jgi:Lar family restriction alleviation protein
MHIENCPFCGSANVKPYEHINEPTDSYCQCADCGTIGPSGKESSKDSAIAAWNLRAALQAQQGEAKVSASVSVTPLYTALQVDAPEPATLSKSQIDAIVYQCRQSGSDTTYDIVAACLAAAAPVPPATLSDEQVIEQVTDLVGLGHGAWDMVDGAELVQAFRTVLDAAGSSQGQVTAIDIRMLKSLADYMERKDESPACATDLRNLANRLVIKETK